MSDAVEGVNMAEVSDDLRQKVIADTLKETVTPVDSKSLVEAESDVITVSYLNEAKERVTKVFKSIDEAYVFLGQLKAGKINESVKPEGAVYQPGSLKDLLDESLQRRIDIEQEGVNPEVAEVRAKVNENVREDIIGNLLDKR